LAIRRRSRHRHRIPSSSVWNPCLGRDFHTQDSVLGSGVPGTSTESFSERSSAHRTGSCSSTPAPAIGFAATLRSLCVWSRPAGMGVLQARQGERAPASTSVEDDQQLGDADDPEDQPPAVGMGVCHWEGLQDGRGSGGPARAWPGASPSRVLVPGSGWRSGGDVESVPDVDQGDLDDQRGQGLLVVVRVGLLPDVIGHRVGTVA
jgi:hypothetical protein